MIEVKYCNIFYIVKMALSVCDFKIKIGQLFVNYSKSSKVPKFLTKVADKVLQTGKYLNVIRQCGNNVHAS